MPGSLVPTPFYRGGPAGREPGQGEHGQGDVGVPGPPGADLVVIQPGLALSLLETLFNPPLMMPLKLQSSPAGRLDLGRY